MAKKSAWLEDRGVIRISGEEASKFLQGLLTNDVERLEAGEARYAALLSPQGKILFDMLVVRIPAEDGAAYLIDCAAAQAADLAKRLSFYKLRAKVAVADESADHGVVAEWGDEPQNAVGGVAYRDPRAPLGWRAILPRDQAMAVGAGYVHEYEGLRIALAVPKGGVDFAYGDAFPHDANLDSLNGVDFDKGCYVGQEVVSRMQHRGTARTRTVKIVLDGPAPEAGASILAGDKPVGTIGSTAGESGLALVRTDRVADALAAGQPLTAGGLSLHLADPEALLKVGKRGMA